MNLLYKCIPYFKKNLKHWRGYRHYETPRHGYRHYKTPRHGYRHYETPWHGYRLYETPRICFPVHPSNVHGQLKLSKLKIKKTPNKYHVSYNKGFHIQSCIK